MYDFWLEQRVDWNEVLFDSSPIHRKHLWQEIESLRSSTVFVEQIETTNCCPLRCVMCPRGRGLMSRTLGNMDSVLFESLCLQIDEGWQARLGTQRDPLNLHMDKPSERIEIIGLRLHHFGSPLVDPMFISRVKWVKDHCSFPVHASVSAEQLRGDAADRLIDSGIDRIVIALDGINAEDYCSVRGRAASYDLACKGIKALLNVKRRMLASTIIDIQIIDFGYDQNRLNIFRKQWLGSGANPIVKPVFLYPDINIVPGDVTLWSGPCSWPFLSMVVLMDGRVVPCCADYNAEMVIGDATESSLVDIWNGELYREFRRRFLMSATPPSLCRRCGFYGRVQIWDT